MIATVVIKTCWGQPGMDKEVFRKWISVYPQTKTHKVGNPWSPELLTRKLYKSSVPAQAVFCHTRTVSKVSDGQVLKYQGMTAHLIYLSSLYKETEVPSLACYVFEVDVKKGYVTFSGMLKIWLLKLFLLWFVYILSEFFSNTEPNTIKATRKYLLFQINRKLFNSATLIKSVNFQLWSLDSKPSDNLAIILQYIKGT